ncbi:V-set and immunoglobulin domain-containing protein 1 isoform X2 [Podarcis raffonei]|uniref:V-set and immunoglobulin domain-containing protein 1 isoform X2 n=1 Tax=Podarcis raffonei TaxID=65483 RepID=UPI0023296095|nr:V-set and immunoglobulin domain-containing protein 1 isoform X2 [Podarcis raffonei]
MQQHLRRFLSGPVKTPATMLKILVILAAITGPVSCVIVTMPQTAVNTTVGANVTLLCTYRTEMSISGLFIQWSFYNHISKNRPIIYYRQGSISNSYGRFHGRIRAATGLGNASITILNMQASDSGIYTCEVFNPENPNTQGEKTMSVSVLVPPSKPHCSFVQDKEAEIGHAITLFCFSETGMPEPMYLWHRVSGDSAVHVTGNYIPQSGRLVIGNLTKFEEGYYRCTAINSLGNSTCQIDLTTKHSEGGIIVGALIAAILAAALIGVIVWVVASKEKEKKKKEKAAISEMQTVAHKEPLNVAYAAVPSQESAPVAAVPPSKESNETSEYSTPEEAEVATMPENATQEMERQPVA